MNETLYRVTGLKNRWDPETRSYKATESRVTVRRSQKADLAVYEDLDEAKRGLTGLRSRNTLYSEFRIESLTGTWEAM